MSLIHGVVSFGGDVREVGDIRRMVSAGERVGGEPGGHWRGGMIALAANPMRTLPGHRHDNRPVITDVEAGLALVCDARIDNREALRRALGGREQRLSDAELILAAYRRWGEACVEHLLGDFAFALWDARERRLFCARDPFGQRPFYYHHAEGRFLFSSDLAALLSLEAVPKRLDEGYVADALGGLHLYTDKTPYRDIHCLGKACRLRVKEGGLREGGYWRPDSEREIRFAREEEYVERYRELFTEAVACRLASDDPVGSFVSGGLDSSSIAAMAGRLLHADGRSVHAFCHVLPEGESSPEGDERALVERLAERPGMDVTWVSRENFEPAAVARGRDDPLNIDAPFVQTSLSHARRSGCRVMLCGFGGDAAATSHAEHLAIHLLRQGEFFGFLHQARAMAEHRGHTTPRAALGLIRHGYSPRSGPSSDGVIRRFLVETCLFNRDFVERFDVVAMAREARRFKRGDTSVPFRETMWRDVNEGVNHHNIEAAMACRAGMELRRPMLDRRLVEFALAAPPEQHRLGHQGRRLIRRAMAGILPDEIRLRHDKRFSSNPGFRKYLLATLDGQRELLARAAAIPEIGGYIDLAEIGRRLEALPELVRRGEERRYKGGATGRALRLVRFLVDHYEGGG